MTFRSVILIFLFQMASAQEVSVIGKVIYIEQPLEGVTVLLKGLNLGTITDSKGQFKLDFTKLKNQKLIFSYIGYKPIVKKINYDHLNLGTITLEADESLDEVVVSGTLKPVSKLDSSVPVEVYAKTFFKANPTASIFEALENINGIRPQLNCSVCNTGDIHINGLEGPYTLVMIDGMPIVSGLSTVYGLSGIPNSLIEQIEIVKGPASSLYGSEALGGLINIITKLPENAPLFFAESFGTSWGEINFDLGVKANVGKNATVLVGANYFKYDQLIDNNNDNFTDLTNQDRISLFQKWNFKRRNKRNFSIAGRYFYEDRWGGELQWNKSFRGGDEVYGESIYTSRFEIFGNYQLPLSEKIDFQFSYSDHDQNSVYGNTPYLAQQRIGFGQFIWDKKIKSHDLLLGTAIRYNYYNDNTTATIFADKTAIPSLFVQDEIGFNNKQSLLLGMRYDYNSSHGNIFTPRIAYRFKPTDDDIIRLNAGTGFRVVNLFTEEHAALTGAREVIIKDELNPEESYNITLNYLKKLYLKNGMYFTIDTSAWYTYFTNAIIPDYDTNPNQIIYDNLDGFSQSSGLSFNIDAVFGNGIRASIGATYQDVSKTENGIKTPQILTEKYSGVWSLSYKHYGTNLTFDYTGSLYGPMRLPLLGELDPRSEYSPAWSIQNIQITYDGIDRFEMYGGIKNLLDWTPNKGNPFIIARSDDPFDQNVVFDTDGNATPTLDNPYALTFDPSYVYGPNQGIRLFFGIRYALNNSN